MGFPGAGITALSLTACIYLIFAAGVQSRLVLAEACAGAWTVAALAWAIWSVLIYPRCVSPLRKLPTAGGAHWLFGHGQRLMEPEGEPTREWYEHVPPCFLVFSSSRLLLLFWFLPRLVGANTGMSRCSS